MAEPRVSVAIAVHNEQAVFPELVRRLVAVLDGLPGGPHEMVFVDDGSTDRTFDLIVEAAATDRRVVGVRLSRNFGHQAALTAALEAVDGRRRHRHGRRPPGPSRGDPSVRRRVREGVRRRLRAARATEGVAAVSRVRTSSSTGS